MGTSFDRWRGARRSEILCALWSVLVAASAGCGGKAGFVTPPGISVALPISTVTLTQSGSAVIIPIQIQSTSETALVMVTQLPGGVAEMYSATDTSPSGTLKFAADTSAMAGTYMPTVSVQSAGSMASTSFTLIVKMQ